MRRRASALTEAEKTVRERLVQQGWASECAALCVQEIGASKLTRVLESGALLNPWNRFVGAFVPNWLCERREISEGAKLTYGRLTEYAGRKGCAFPGRAALAQSLGVSESQVDRNIEELRKRNLIMTIRRGLQRSNVYFFLRHEWAEGALGPDSAKKPTQESASMQTQQFARAANLDSAKVRTPLGKESGEKNQEKVKEGGLSNSPSRTGGRKLSKREGRHYDNQEREELRRDPAGLTKLQEILLSLAPAKAVDGVEDSGLQPAKGPNDTPFPTELYERKRRD